MDVFCFPLYITLKHDGTLYAASSINNSYQSFLIITTDNGQQFTAIEGTNYPYDETPNYVYAHNNKLFLSGTTLSVSTDDAQSWSENNGGIVAGTRPGAMTVLGNTLFLAATNYVSYDERKLYQSTDDGQSWSIVTTTGLPGDALPFNDLTASEGRLFAALGNYGAGAGIYYSDDNGASWSQAKFDSSPDGDFFTRNAFARGQKNELFISGYHLDPNTVPIYRSTDNGINWSKITHTSLETLWATPAFCNVKDGGFVFGGVSTTMTADGRIFKSENTVGISDNMSNNGTLVYPNPAAHYVEVTLPGNFTVKECVISDISGTEIRVYSKINRLDVSDLSSGVYFLRLTLDDGSKEFRRW